MSCCSHNMLCLRVKHGHFLNESGIKALLLGSETERAILFQQYRAPSPPKSRSNPLLARLREGGGLGLLVISPLQRPRRAAGPSLNF